MREATSFALFAILPGLVDIPCLIHSFIASEHRELESIRRQSAELVKEKLAVIHTAICMGYQRDVLADLDS